MLLADYALYRLLAPVGGRPLDRGENGLWLRYHWYFGRKTDAEVRDLARRLRDDRIRDAFFHVRHARNDGSLAYRYPEEARRLLQVLRREAPGVRAVAWVYAGNERGAAWLSNVNLQDPAVRRRMVEEARWLVTDCGFDGVQWDYEICPDGDAGFLELLDETHAALPPGKLLSVATPIWLPDPLPRRWGWSDRYFSEVARRTDQMAVMGYDTAMYLPRAYVALMRAQAVHVTRAVRAGNPECRVLIGVPTYGAGPPSHHAWSENLSMALKGVREGLADPRAAPEVFAGVAPFADYTTQPDEWAEYRRLWLGR